jgi:hypothetical protein
VQLSYRCVDPSAPLFWDSPRSEGCPDSSHSKSPSQVMVPSDGNIVDVDIGDGFDGPFPLRFTAPDVDPNVGLRIWEIENLSPRFSDPFFSIGKQISEGCPDSYHSKSHPISNKDVRFQFRYRRTRREKEDPKIDPIWLMNIVEIVVDVLVFEIRVDFFRPSIVVLHFWCDSFHRARPHKNFRIHISSNPHE